MKSKKILIVDDEKDFVETVRNFLTERGYEVSAAYDGRDALEKAKELPSLILLDIKMPDMDGFEVLRRLRSEHITTTIPVIMLTVKHETESIFEAKDLEATDYLMKPISLEELWTMIGRYLDEDKVRPLNI